MTAYNRGQVLYRVAEMMEARDAELAELCAGREEVERSIDRVVWYAGWTDKLAQVLGGANPVAGPYFNFTVPEPTGVVGIVAPAEPALLGLVSRLAPVLAGGNVAVVIASEAHPRAAIELAEVLATSDVPGGVVNILTGLRDELAPHLASHLDVDALDLDRGDAELERAAADNVKRVVFARGDAPEPVRDLELPRAQDGHARLLPFALGADRAFAFADARAEPALAANPVVEQLGVIAYAGVPLRVADGEPIGTLAVDHAPHAWSDDDLDYLSDLAASAVAELQLLAAGRRAARGTDPDVGRAELRAAHGRLRP